MKNKIIYIFSTFIIISCGGNYSGNEDTVLRSIKSPLFLVTDDKNVYKSNDADNWNSYSLTFTNSTSLNYFNKSFILTGMNGDGENLSFSKNGETWKNLKISSKTLESIVFRNGLYVVVGDMGVIYTSSDGLNLGEVNYESDKQFHGVSFGNNIFVAVGRAGYIKTSPDSNTWTQRNSGISEGLNEIIFVNNNFYISGSNGKILKSNDGITWHILNTGITNPLNSIAYGNEIFIAVGDSGTIIRSEDEENWTKVNIESGYNKIINDIVYGNNMFVAVGGFGAILVSKNNGISWEEYSVGNLNSLKNISYKEDI